MRTGNVGFVGHLIRWSLIGLVAMGALAACGKEDPQAKGSLISFLTGR